MSIISAEEGTIATLITVYGASLIAIGWGLALSVWGYALAMVLVTDQVRVRACALLEHEGIRFRR